MLRVQVENFRWKRRVEFFQCTGCGSRSLVIGLHADFVFVNMFIWKISQDKHFNRSYLKREALFVSFLFRLLRWHTIISRVTYVKGRKAKRKQWLLTPIVHVSQHTHTILLHHLIKQTSSTGCWCRFVWISIYPREIVIQSHCLRLAFRPLTEVARDMFASCGVPSSVNAGS